MGDLWNDRTMDALFGPRAAIVESVRPAAVYTLQAEKPRTGFERGYRWINPKKLPGPRGGDANRAKTKASRKANLARRRKSRSTPKDPHPCK